MLKEKQIQLKEKLNIILDEIGHLNDIKQEIGKDFISRNLSAHRAMNVWMKNESLETISDSENDIRFLFLFSFALEKSIKKLNLEDITFDVREYFTNVEYRQWKEYKEEEKIDNIYPIVFEDMQQLSDRIWQGKMSAQQFAKLKDNNVLLYDFSMQRAPKITISGVRIDFNKKKSIEISKRILTGKQYPDQIKLNVLNNFKEKIYYNSKNKTLTIFEGSIYIFDGHHRGVGNSLAIEENPEVDFTWGLIIANLTEEEIRDYVVQIDKQKPIKKEQIKEWDLEKQENLIVSVISKDKISKLNKVMVSQEVEIKHQRGLVTKNIIAEAIAENYELNDTTDIRGIGNWIVEFTDHLFSLYPEAFITNPYKIKEKSYINHKNMFYAYIALSAKLKNSIEWKDIIKIKMQSIDFNKENQLWKDIGLNTNRVNKTLRNKLYKLFIEGSDKNEI